MLKALIALLLAVNGLLLAALLGAFEGLVATGSAEREPARLQRQIRPETVQLTPGGPAGAAALVTAAAPAPAAASALPAAGAAPAASTTAASAALATAAALACRQAGPFDAAQLAQAERVLRAAGLPDASWQRAALPPARSWLVAMGPYADRTQLARKEAELRRRNVAYTTLTPGPELPPDLAPGLALGRYETAAAAEAALDRLNDRGVRSARVVALGPVADGRAMLRVPAADAARLAQLAQLALPAGLRWGACPGADNGAAQASAPLSAPR